jgi:hypothetical protein
MLPGGETDVPVFRMEVKRQIFPVPAGSDLLTPFERPGNWRTFPLLPRIMPS